MFTLPRLLKKFGISSANCFISEVSWPPVLRILAKYFQFVTHHLKMAGRFWNGRLWPLTPSVQSPLCYWRYQLRALKTSKTCLPEVLMAFYQHLHNVLSQSSPWWLFHFFSPFAAIELKGKWTLSSRYQFLLQINLHTSELWLCMTPVYLQYHVRNWLEIVWDKTLLSQALLSLPSSFVSVSLSLDSLVETSENRTSTSFPWSHIVQIYGMSPEKPLHGSR